VPDVKLYFKEELAVRVDRLWEELPAVVATQMSCLVPDKRNPDQLVQYDLDPNGEIDLFLFWCDEPHQARRTDIQLRSKSYAILEVGAYPFEDRMKNIGERMGAIAHAVKLLLGLSEDQKVSHTFVAVKDGLWGSV